MISIKYPKNDIKSGLFAEELTANTIYKVVSSNGANFVADLCILSEEADFIIFYCRDDTVNAASVEWCTENNFEFIETNLVLNISFS